MKSLIHKITAKLKGNTDGMEGSFLSNGVMTFINQFGNLGISLIIMILLRRWLGEEQSGTFVAGFTYAFLLAQVAIFGFDNLSIREVSSLLAKNDKSSMIKFMKLSNLLVWGLSLILTTALGYWFFIQETEESNFYILSIMIVPFFTLLMLNQFKLLGMGFVVSSQTPEKLIRPLLFLIPFVFIHYFLPDYESLLNILVLNIIAFVIVYMISDILISRNFKVWLADFKSKKEKIPSTQAKTWIYSATGLFIYSIIGHINGKIDIVMLDEMIDNNAGITYYNTAHRFGGFVAFGALIVNQMMGPIISNHFTRKEMEPLKKMVAKSSLFSFLIAIPLLLFFYLCGEWMLNFLFERSIPEEHEVLMITSMGYLFQVIAGSAAFLLIMNKSTAWLATLSIVIGLIINVVCNYLFIPEYGIIGAAYGTTGALLAWTILMVIFVSMKLQLNPTFFSRHLFS